MVGSWLGRAALVVLLGAFGLGVSRDARACGAIGYDVEIVLPLESAAVVPRKSVLLARIWAPAGDPVVVLRTLDGREVEIESELEVDTTNTVGLLRARPLELLEPDTVYVWDVDGVAQRELTTGSDEETAPPMLEGFQLLSASEREGAGDCGPATFVEHEIEVLGVGDLVATYAQIRRDGAWVDLAIAPGPRLVVQNSGAEELCVEILTEDQAGYIVSAGETCVPAPDGQPEADPADTDDASADETMHTIENRGCACASSPSPWSSPSAFLLSWLLLGARVRARRDPESTPTRAGG